MGQIHSVVQGSAEWDELRAAHYTASEAPAMMGASKYQSRSELLRQKATGDTPEVDAQKQRLFDAGHAAEAAARPIAEGIIGEELYQATVTDEFEGLPLLASCDGLTLLGDIAFEHKLYSQDLARQIESGDLEDHYIWQLEQQGLVTGADKILFMASDGTEERCVWTWYTPGEGLGQKLVAGWQQFHADLQAYEPREEKAEPTGSAPGELPALRIEVHGEVTDSNLDAFREKALAVFQGINTDLQTDEHFADADKTCKWCKQVEERLEAAKEHALSQTESIDRLFKTIDEIKDQARQTRLDLEKQVKARKQAIRDEIQQGAVEQLRECYRTINTSLPEGIELGVPADFGSTVGAAMKGKKTVKSLRDAADDAVAKAKIEANERADLIRANVKRFAELADGYESLFPDKNALLEKAGDDLTAVIKARIAEHRAEEQRRQEAEQARQAEQAPQEPDPAAEATEAAPEPEAPTEADTAAASGKSGQADEVEWDVNCQVQFRTPSDWTQADVEKHVQIALQEAGLGDVIAVSVQRNAEAA